MLNTTNPQALKKLKQADNNRVLIDILRGQDARGEPESNLNYFTNKYGTAFCLLGSYLKDSFEDEDQFNDLCSAFDTDNEFGFGGTLDDLCLESEGYAYAVNTEWSQVFGGIASGTRQDLIKVLEGHIERLEREAVEFA